MSLKKKKNKEMEFMEGVRYGEFRERKWRQRESVCVERLTMFWPL